MCGYASHFHSLRQPLKTTVVPEVGLRLANQQLHLPLSGGVISEAPSYATQTSVYINIIVIHDDEFVLVLGPARRVLSVPVSINSRTSKYLLYSEGGLDP